MYWANFLHIYQPPTQTLEILDRVTNESYRKIFAGLIKNPNGKLTLNINAVLTEMLAENGYMDVIEDIKTLLKRGQLELTASAKYHPLLPKIPEDFVIRQIQLNEETNKRYYGNLYQPQGFFPPEMGYSPNIASIVKKMGYKWMILDELACDVPYNSAKNYVNSEGLYFFFRERGASFKILSAQLGTGRSVIREFGDRITQQQYLLTGMDGETFGHHRPGLEQLLLEIYQEEKMPTVKISQLIDLFPETLTVNPRTSTWALMPKDIAKNMPFSRWDNPENPIHQLQWELTNLAIALSRQEADTERNLIDIALHSDQYWWASARPWWSIEMIERGAFELLTAIRAFKHVSDNDKKKAWDLYIAIITTAFEWQRNGTVANLSKKEDEELVERMDQDLPFLSKDDYEKMLATLENQMLTAAGDREYARAEMLRMRISELQDEMNKVPTDGRKKIKVNQ